VGLGALHAALLEGLADKRDLGVHTEVLTDAVMHLVSRGVITNRRKGLNEGKLVASSAIGSHHLFDFLDDNPLVELQPVDVVADPAVVRAHPNMMAINEASAIDLTGQVAADALPSSLYGGVSGMLDFHRGALRSRGGKAIVALPSTDPAAGTSRIVPRLEQTAAVIPRGDVQVVVTEYGAVNLLGKSLQERATALISIAHPDHRESLFHAATRAGLLGPERRLRDAIRGIYPLHLEERLELDGTVAVIRPARPSDDRRVQEHFYGLRRQDVSFRFFREKTSFYRSELEPMVQIDYVRDLTLLAVIGEVGFEEVVGVGGYLLEGAADRAEVAFSVSPAWQRRGIGRHLLHLLARAARSAGIAGFVAYTYPENAGMRKLFATLPHPVGTRIEDEMLVLTCRLDEAPSAPEA
jgi:GNAT superfamily N-acetyltransferase